VDGVYFIYTAISWLTLQGFGVAAGFVLQNGWFVSNLLGVVVLLCMFVLLQMTVALMSFRLISQLPHQVVKMIGLQPANRVDMDRFAADAGMVGMNASLRGIQGGTGAMLESATKAGGGGGMRALADGSRSAENGGPKLLGTDSTLQAASEVTPPAAGKGGTP